MCVASLLAGAHCSRCIRLPLFLAFLWGFGGCAASQARSAATQSQKINESASPAAARAANASQTQRRPSSGARAEPAPGPRRKRRRRSARSATPAQDKAVAREPAAGSGTTEAAQRRIHYNGYARLRVAQPRQAADRAESIVRAAGGHLQRRQGRRLTVRVPVDAFERVFERLLAIGEVLDRSVTARDVTAAYTDVALRLRVLKQTRERLMGLVSKARSERERMQLLARINKLTRKIDRLEAQLATLANLGAFSRITLELVPRKPELQQPADEPIAALRWIMELSPFKRAVTARAARLQLSVPEGMVDLGQDGPFVAESPDGAVVWAGRRRNEPMGSQQFWIEAIDERLSPEYAAAKRIFLGAYEGIRLVGHGDNPFIYVVAVRVDADRLDLVQIHYPTPEHEAQYHSRVRAALQATGGAG